MFLKDLVHQLNELLRHYPEAEVYLQRDPEGNGYSPCQGADTGYYDEGEFLSNEHTADQVCKTEAVWKKFKEENKVGIVLWPKILKKEENELFI